MDGEARDARRARRMLVCGALIGALLGASARMVGDPSAGERTAIDALFFARAAGRPDPAQRALDALRALEGGGTLAAAGAQTDAMPSGLPAGPLSDAELDEALGPDLAAAAHALPVGRWSEPLELREGVVLVRVRERTGRGAAWAAPLAAAPAQASGAIGGAGAAWSAAEHVLASPAAIAVLAALVLAARDGRTLAAALAALACGEVLAAALALRAASSLAAPLAGAALALIASAAALPAASPRRLRRAPIALAFGSGVLLGPGLARSAGGLAEGAVALALGAVSAQAALLAALAALRAFARAATPPRQHRLAADTLAAALAALGVFWGVRG